MSPRAVDTGLTALVAAAQLWPFAARAGGGGGPWSGWGVLVVLASAVPLYWRRSHPIPVLLVSLAATSSYDYVGEVPPQPVWYAGVVAIHSVAERSGRWARNTVVAATVLGSFALASSESGLRMSVLCVAAYALGRAAAAGRAHAERLERERLAEVEKAALAERARIARDMHDILSHAVSLMVVQAEAGPVVLATDPARAERAFDAIAGAGRDAMVQLRGILKVLGPDRAPQPERTPQPTLADLPVLTAGSGLTVECTQTDGSAITVGYPQPDGAGHPLLAPHVETAAFRIVQEALTNIVRHAGTDRARLHLHWQEDQGIVQFDITDDGVATGQRPVRSLPSGGHGLINIRERARSCGGTAECGPRTDGPGFRVRARLPLLLPS
ncbi:sensor histidine kinase [Streptomyces sp. HB132]|uniref:sensor histidine kinase n=1 Tax=Streptomyces sp. HB132 TaxID=767388 RepID=UPI001D44BDE2|nr:histidine kinase [Streptomyces sp. HB132]MBM7443072.1 signal transduction histidine kinase [Streptomyces sp. HB132]